MCKIDKQTIQKSQVMNAYPRYLSNCPEGVDLFEGKSQDRLADAIAMHITETDKVEKSIFARLIGLEGKWGSGKSNVIKILENRLKESYTFFCFDAWGNQEDLQRRSILELLTRDLMEKGKLTGKTKMRVLSQKCEGKLVDVECTWDEKLESLLSRKSYTKDITVPSLNNATKWFVLVLLLVGLFVTYLSVDETGAWWGNLLIALSPMLVFTAVMLITRSSWRKMFAMYNTEGRSDTTSFVISEQEPSVREFKDWMKEISNGIPATDKLVLVFDNMDRLPSDKVHQFWSLIQTFFADANDGYRNIWCIVPYDESHLAAVFSGEGDKSESLTLLRGFLDKTFPVSYRVPEPIVADYKIIFEQLFCKAFGNTVDYIDVEAISRCYRHIHPEPNVRDMITFINSNVVLAKEWNNALHPLSIAIYVLKADEMLRPKVKTNQSDKEIGKAATTEEYLLAAEYYSDFQKLMFGHPSVDYLSNEIAALVYGVEPAKAQELVVKRHIRNCMSDKDNKLTFDQYVGNPQFIHLLEDEVHNLEVTEYEQAVKLIDRIVSAKLTPEVQSRLEGIWQHMGRQFNALKGSVSEYGEYHSTLFKHLSPANVEVCATAFCQRLINNKDVGGAQLFENLSALFNDDYAQSFDVSTICPQSILEAKRFADYAKQAGTNYKRFPLKAKPAELNKFLSESIGKEYPYLQVLPLLKEDDNYTVAEVGKYSVQQFDLKQADALTAANLIAVQRVFFDKFPSQCDANYKQTLWNEVQADTASAAYDEVYALKTVESFEGLPDDEHHINILVQKAFFYNTTSQLLQHYLSGPNVSFRRNLLIRMMNENLHDSQPDYPEFIENWQNLANGLGVSKETIIRFADSWGYRLLPVQSKQKPYFTLLSDVAWIDALIAANTPLAKELLTKCVAEMAQQTRDQYLQTNTANHTNTIWSRALQKLIITNYITQSSFGVMVDIAVSLLDYVAKNSSFDDAIWKQLLAKVNYASISASFMTTRNNILNGQSGYVMNPSKFLQLHEWLEQSEINTADHCTDAANQILAKVVDDTNCQTVILAKRDYYRPIIANTKRTASILHDKLKAIIQNQGDSEFAKYIQQTISYDEE
jgi:hypothetical protein